MTETAVYEHNSLKKSQLAQLSESIQKISCLLIISVVVGSSSSEDLLFVTVPTTWRLQAEDKTNEATWRRHFGETLMG